MMAEFAGQAISQAIGFSQASTLNPTLGTQDMVLSRVISLFALLFALAAGVHRARRSASCSRRFARCRSGHLFSFAPTAMKLIDLSISSFTLGIGLALPLIAVALVVQLGLAMIARAAPSLQIFSVGWGVLLASGAVVLLSSLHDLASGMTAHMTTLPTELDGLLVALSGT